jgi:flavin-dependent dehydrogenase
VPDVDVVVVGASVAGCAAATLLARQGLTVALVEKSPDPRHHKALCTHELVALATPVLDRLGVLDELRELGGPHRSTRIWTRYGWTRPGRIAGDRVDEGLNVRRVVLDPVVRRAAAETAGVELALGARVVEVTRSPTGAVDGVVTRGSDGAERRISARVVVGADGAGSAVAKLTGTATRTSPHGRFGYAAYFEGIPPTLEDGLPTSQFWWLGPDLVYCFPTDGGLTLLAAAPLKTPERLAAFKRDLEAEFLAMFDGLSRGPDLTDARRVGRFHGQIATQNHRRTVAAPGLAFVGDAAQVTDFVWGTGCGFALRSAELLADAVGPVLRDGVGDPSVARALRRYGRAHRRAFGAHYRQTSSFSTGRPFTLAERLLFAAAVDDDVVARAVRRVGSRSVPPWRAVTPAVVGRIARHRLRSTVLPTRTSTLQTGAPR